jgi:hypothetical protein
MSSSVAELFRRSVTFPDPSSRIAGLAIVRSEIEAVINHLEGRRRERLRARLKRQVHWMEEYDTKYSIPQLKATIDELFLGTFIISLWSVFEVCIKDLAEYVRQEKGLPFGMQDLRAGDFLEQTQKFFAQVLSLKPFHDRSVRAKLEELKGFRNALVHHNGSTEQLPKSLRSKTESEYRSKGLLVYRDLHHEYAMPTGRYADGALKTVRTFLEQFAENVYVAIHPVPLEDDA